MISDLAFFGIFSWLQLYDADVGRCLVEHFRIDVPGGGDLSGEVVGDLLYLMAVMAFDPLPRDLML